MEYQVSGGQTGGRKTTRVPGLSHPASGLRGLRLGWTGSLTVGDSRAGTSWSPGVGTETRKLGLGRAGSGNSEAKVSRLSGKGRPVIGGSGSQLAVGVWEG